MKPSSPYKNLALHNNKSYFCYSFSGNPNYIISFRQSIGKSLQCTIKIIVSIANAPYSLNELQNIQLRIMKGRGNSPFDSCVLGELAFEWKRGWR